MQIPFVALYANDTVVQDNGDYYRTSGVVNSEGYKHKPVAQKKKASLVQEYQGKKQGEVGTVAKWKTQTLFEVGSHSSIVDCYHMQMRACY